MATEDPKTPQRRRSAEGRKPSDSEESFLAAYDASRFDRPSVTVDVVLITAREGSLWTLLVPRGEHPFRGSWALPGGFVGIGESLEEAAGRVLSAKAGLGRIFLQQLYTFGRPDRDPRTRVITVAYYALVEPAGLLLPAASAGRLARIVVPWQGESGGPVEIADEELGTLPLAFDHAEILGLAVRRLRGKLNYSSIGFQLLPETFTLRQLQTVHETILGRSLNKDSFRRRLLASGSLGATGEKESDVGYRPAELYRFLRRTEI